MENHNVKKLKRLSSFLDPIKKFQAYSFVIIICLYSSSFSLPAFLGAQGSGTNTIGGRGGKIIEVTNLGDAGTGSLRAAIQASGARIIVFRVGGTITLNSCMSLNNPNITIAGQTAPGAGIQIRCNKSYQDDLLKIYTHDVVIRYIKFRQGGNGAGDASGGGNVTITSGAYNVVIDHCSFAWNNFDAVASGWSSIQHDITISWNLIAEPLRPNGCVAMAWVYGNTNAANASTNVDVHHNFFTGATHRIPLVDSKNGRIVNNIVYNWYSYATRAKGIWDIIGNYYKHGPMASSTQHEITLFTGMGSGCTSEIPSLYVAGNAGPNNSWNASDASEWSHLVRQAPDQDLDESSSASTNYKRLSAQGAAASGAAITLDPANSLSSVVLPTVGASQTLDLNGNWVDNRDALDLRYITEFKNNTGIKNWQNFFDESNTSGYPELASGTPYTDSDHDGMPDAWEKSHGLNPNDPLDGAKDKDGNGYTNVEDFLNGIAQAGTSIQELKTILTSTSYNLRVPIAFYTVDGKRIECGHDNFRNPILAAQAVYYIDAKNKSKKIVLQK